MIQPYLLKDWDCAWMVLDHGDRMAVAASAYFEDCSSEALSRITEAALDAAGQKREPTVVCDLVDFLSQHGNEGEGPWAYDDIEADNESDLLELLAETPDVLRSILQANIVTPAAQSGNEE